MNKEIAASEKANAHSKSAPFITITKRDASSLKRNIVVRIIAIAAALVVSALLTLFITGENPIKLFSTVIEGAFGQFRIWGTAQSVAMLLGIALALTPAFKMKFWNTGGEGQVLIGALASALVMMTAGGLPHWLASILVILAGVLAGAIWGIIPAIFKAYWKTNETLFTLMMNYVAIQLIKYFLKVADGSGSSTVGPSLLLYGRLPVLFNQQYMLNIIVVAAMTIMMYIYLKISKHGYEISVVGESENTAKYIGINVKKVVIRTMALSGALCGLIGVLLVGATSYSIDPNLAGGNGFTAIMVSWLAKFNPIIMIFTTLLIVVLSRGAENVSMTLGLNKSFSDILTGIILFFIIGCEFFINYQIHFNIGKKRKEEAEDNGNN
ncbi:MAG: ABC transporter permease [Clostridia bacterium]|nr:ABC transporter permease [Clostridia bacterium]